MVLFKIQIDVDRHVSKKNSRPIFRRGNKSFIGKSTDLRSAEQYLCLALKCRKNELKKETITTQINGSFKFFFLNYYNKDGSENKKVNDLINLIELPADCLQEAGVIENDRQIRSLNECGIYPSHKNYMIITLNTLD